MGFVVYTVPESAGQNVLELVKERREKDEEAFKKEENAIDAELLGLAKISKDFTKEVTTRLSHLITAVNGNSERVAIRKFINEQLTSRDSLSLRSHIRETMPDIDTRFDFVCNHCGTERKEETPMGVSFFWPNGRV